MFNPAAEERVNALIKLVRENNPSEKHVEEEDALSTFPGEEQWTLAVLENLGLGESKTGWDSSPRNIRERLKSGQLISDRENGAEIADVFSTLSEKETEKFWANVADEIAYEEWVAAERVDHPFHTKEVERKPPLMRPPISSSTVMSLEDALNRLGRVRARGNQWIALCPVHEDRSPSLVVMEHKDYPGEGFFYCYAGCTHLQIRAKLMGMGAHG